MRDLKTRAVLNGLLLPLILLEVFFLVVVWRCRCNAHSWSDPLLYLWLGGILLIVESVRRGAPLNLRHLLVITPGLLVCEFFPQVPTIVASVAIGWVLLTAVRRGQVDAEGGDSSAEESLVSR